MIKKVSPCFFAVVLLVSIFNALEATSCYPRSIFVPRQLSYNPIFENALMLDTKINETWDWIFSVKPIYTQSVGSKFKKYFTINHACSLNVQENGSGDIDSLWFNVISPTGTFYSSQLSFNPKRQTYGALLYFTAQLPCDFQIAITTAVVTARNSMHICESGIENPGVCPCYATITQSFANGSRLFGRINGAKKKTGVDDVQVKLIYEACKNDCLYWDVYGLVGIPTGEGSKARNLFEPLVGSNHAQLGLGTDAQWNIMECDCWSWTLLGEAKYRYGFRATEDRSFDLKNNGQWSRYMLFVAASDPYNFYPAINNLTFPTKVTPRSSFDLYVATHADYNSWNFELGYDFWFRSAEKIALCCAQLPNGVGIADLKGIAVQAPVSASSANISQGIAAGTNQMISDATFVPVTLSDINCRSGAAPRSISNSVYDSIGYKCNYDCYELQIGLNGSYEAGSSVNTPDNTTVWLNFDLQY